LLIEIFVSECGPQATFQRIFLVNNAQPPETFPAKNPTGFNRVVKQTDSKLETSLDHDSSMDLLKV